MKRRLLKMAVKKTLRLQPIQGKFVQSIIHGRIVRVWLVDPDTNEMGTDIEYSDAINILSLPKPVVCLAQIKGKDGKYIQQLDDDDKKLIEERKAEFASGQLSSGQPQGGSDNFALQKLVETQSKLIDSQSKQMEAMQAQFAKMQKDFEKLVKKSK